MSVIKQLENQFFEIDNDYSSKEFRAHVKGYSKKEAYWRRKRELNTHAYFLFVFTRLEDHIKTHSSALIQRKRSNIGHWKTRSIWEITDSNGLHFKRRVRLLTETGQVDYIRISDYYEARNTIAHGGTIPGITIAINMIDVFNDMKRFFAQLK